MISYRIPHILPNTRYLDINLVTRYPVGYQILDIKCRISDPSLYNNLCPSLRVDSWDVCAEGVAVKEDIFKFLATPAHIQGNPGHTGAWPG